MTTISDHAETASVDSPVISASPERIAELTDELIPKLQMANKAIEKVNSQTRLLSFNAQIEAARAGGGSGAAFGVVASAMRDLADKTANILTNLEKETDSANSTLQTIIKILATSVRGGRLSDLALTNIDMVDRNLYERSCDVRWWATDSSAIDALTSKTTDAYSFCSDRFGMILNSYTVYFDLVLCDLNGAVVTNGRPTKYHCAKSDCSGKTWFKEALATSSGEEFAFESVHRCALTNNERALVYSCVVRAGGAIDGAPLGVLGIIFNWNALAQTIVNATPLSIEESHTTRVCMVDETGLILADSFGIGIDQYLNLPGWDTVVRQGKGYFETEFNGKLCCVGFAHSPGYETYRTGWYSVIIQSLN